MADTTTQVTLRFKRGTSAEWAVSPYVLTLGEPGYDTTVKRLKVGDGVNQWALLKWQDVDPATLARVESAAEAIEGATTPTDGVMAAVAADPASAFSGQLSNAFVGVEAANLNVPKFRDETPTVPIAVMWKDEDDTTPGAWDFLVKHTTGYAEHVQTREPVNADVDGAFVRAIGLDASSRGGGMGIGGYLFSNKKRAVAVRIHQQATITHSDAYGLHGYQESTLAPIIRLEQRVTNAAPLIDAGVTGAAPAGTAQKLARFTTAGNHLAGDISAYDGTFRWIDPAVLYDSTHYTSLVVRNGKGAGDPAYLRVTDPGLNAGIMEIANRTGDVTRVEQTFWASTGSGSYWSYRMRTAANRFDFMAAGPAAKGSETFTPVISIANNAVGFYNTAPIAKRGATADATDLASALTLVNALKADLVAYGLKAS
jgi:hypothetical protein